MATPLFSFPHPGMPGGGVRQLKSILTTALFLHDCVAALRRPGSEVVLEGKYRRQCGGRECALVREWAGARGGSV